MLTLWEVSKFVVAWDPAVQAAETQARSSRSVPAVAGGSPLRAAATASPTAGPGPLMLGPEPEPEPQESPWLETRTRPSEGYPEGRVYYYKQGSDETCWEIPAEPEPEPEMAAQQSVHITATVRAHHGIALLWRLPQQLATPYRPCSCLRWVSPGGRTTV